MSCRSCSGLPASLVSPRYSSICAFSLFCPVFCSFVDVVCVTHLLSSVTGLTAHPLRLSFEGRIK